MREAAEDLFVERDKRGAKWAIPSTYSRANFSVPPNVHLLRMMNTADRSLAVVDYAMRQRFAFVDIDPGFTTSQFLRFLVDRGASGALVDRIVDP